MAGRRQAEEGLSSPTAEEQRRDLSPMVTGHFAQDCNVLRTSPRLVATTMGPGMGLATLSSEVLAFETGSERDTTRADTNRSDRPTRESSGENVEVSQGCLTKCPCCTANYKSANVMRMHLRRTDGDHRKVSGLKQT